MTYEAVRDLKTVGILREDREKRITEIGVPMGIVAALIPSTNPTSTVMYKSLICLKSGNAVIISSHPGAKNSILETCRVVERAAREAGAPEGIVQCVTTPTPESTSALLRHPDIGIILATGGEAMVRAAYSSGNPALGVGPGNGPSYIERSADVPLAIRRIFDSKTFDNGTMSPKVVGRSAEAIAAMAGVGVPAGTRVLISPQTAVGKDNPYSREKLCPVLAFYVEENWERACERCMELLFNEGRGHTMTIHSRNEEVIREFALKKPVSRLLVNTPGALGGVGALTGLQPALTLGCGAVGGSATSDNVGPMNLINIRRVAYGLKELDELRGGTAQSGEETRGEPAGVSVLSREDIEAISRAVIARLMG